MPKKGGKFRINEDIRVREVRLVGADGEMVGVVPIDRAQADAKEADMDLVEVSPNAEPPVCKILDYGKFKYEEKKREHEAKKKQRGGDFKEIRLRPKTDTHDRNIKLDRARRFLREGSRVQVTLLFRGREMQHISRGSEVLNAVAKELEDVAKVERYANRDGRRMHMSLMPKPGVVKPLKKVEKTEKEIEAAKAAKIEKSKKARAAAEAKELEKTDKVETVEKPPEAEVGAEVGAKEEQPAKTDGSPDAPEAPEADSVTSEADPVSSEAGPDASEAGSVTSEAGPVTNEAGPDETAPGATGAAE
jgi:translation initiation factor IF-3